MSEPFIAEVMLFGGNFAIRGWATCSGQLLAINSNQALFSLVGTTYGGDGRTTFGLPDLRGRAVRGSEGNSAGPGLPAVPLGQKSGAENHTMNANEVPAHSHVSRVSSSDASTGDAGVVAQAEDIFRPANDAGTLVDSSATQNAGASQAFSILNPYLGMYYLIALTGVFPSRN